ncbi:Transposable element P transposase [Lucilia cuprina]|nr:Transposable element P transposase [Lucilia cuprina]
MLYRCAVRNCNNNNKIKPCAISFFSFPSDPKLLKQWRSFCGRGKDMNPKTSQICMEHFKSEDFENELQFKLGFTKRLILKSGVVPSVRKLSTEEKERDKRRQKRENKKIVEMLIKEHDEKSVALKEAEKNKQSEQAMKTEIVVKPEFNPVSDLLSIPQKVFSLNNNNNDMDSYKMEIERLRIENLILNENSKKQTAELNALMKKRELENKTYVNNLKSLEAKLLKANYELKNLEEKLLGIFTKRQIAKLKVGDKRIVWSKEDLSQSLVLYETSPKLYKLLYRKNFPLPSVRTLQVWRRKCQDIEINRVIENEVTKDLEREINENLQKQIEQDLEQQIKMEIEIDEIN